MPHPGYTNDHKILSHTNVWAIGATMFELLTLERVDDFFAKQHNGVSRRLNGPALLARYPYQNLMKSILRCLEPLPKDRPTIEQLQESIERERSRVAYSARPAIMSTYPDTDTRLYYKGNEIEKMAPGWTRDTSLIVYAEGPDDCYGDPDLRPLKYPYFANYDPNFNGRDDSSDEHGPNEHSPDEDDEDADNNASGHQGNPINISSSKAASAGADPAESRSTPDSSGTARRRAIKEPPKNAAILGPSAAKGEAKRKREEREIGEDDGRPRTEDEDSPLFSPLTGSEGSAGMSMSSGDLSTTIFHHGSQGGELTPIADTPGSYSSLLQQRDQAQQVGTKGSRHEIASPQERDQRHPQGSRGSCEHHRLPQSID